MLKTPIPENIIVNNEHVVTPVCLKEEQDDEKHCNETMKSCVMDKSIKDESECQLLEYQTVPSPTYNDETRSIKMEFTEDTKETLTEDILEEQKHLPFEDIKYKDDITEYKMQTPEDIDQLSLRSMFDNIVEESSKNIESKAALSSGEQKFNVLISEDKQDAKYFENRTIRSDIKHADNKVILNYKCDHCRKNFCNTSDLDVHIFQVHKKLKFKCNDCHKVFSHKCYLKNHIGVHIGTNLCKYCNKIFTTMKNLDKHINAVHKRVKNNVCGICSKSFFLLYDLKTHIIGVHNRNKNYECNLCNKMFYNTRNLRRHINTVHKGIKNFKCDECCKFYAQFKDLRNHITSLHLKTYEYKCHICMKHFSHLQPLKIHIENVHEGIKKYKCSECCNEFTQLGNLRRHIYAMHEKGKHTKKYC